MLEVEIAIVRAKEVLWRDWNEELDGRVRGAVRELGRLRAERRGVGRAVWRRFDGWWGVGVPGEEVGGEN